MTYFAALTGLLVGSGYGYIAQLSRAVRSLPYGHSEAWTAPSKSDDPGKLASWHRSCFAVEAMEKNRQARPGNWVSHLLALGCASVALFGLNTAVVRAESGAHGTGTEKFDRQMEPILNDYLRIGTALSADSLNGVREKAVAIAKLAGGLDSGSVSGEHAARYKSVPANLEKSAQSLSKAQSLTAARDAFKDLSKPMAMWVSLSKLDVVYCSMAKGSWVQKRGKKSNPYYGPKMLECGEVVGGDGAH